MKTTFTSILAVSRVWIVTVALVGALACPGSGDAFVLSQTQKVLFLGNSITHSGPYPAVGWSGDWGMAASALDKDYVHVLLGEIAGVKGSMPASMVRTISEFEADYKNFDVNANLQAELAFGADAVVVALGENVPYLVPSLQEDNRAAFRNAFGSLLSTLKAHGNPTIFVRSCVWGGGYGLTDQAMQQATAADGDIYVDISAMQSDPTNYATGLFPNAGVASHPCDKGMRYIADAVFGSMVAHSTPEPRPLVLLITGLIGVRAWAWRGRKRE
jgi:hypothetical protein